MENFYSFGLPDALIQSLDKLKFTIPTPIQAATIPLALSGKDVLGSAQTGTGKTGAFGIPLIAKLLSDPRSSALVLTPTRELAAQVMQSLQDLLGRNSPIKAALLIGGDPMGKQMQQLRMRPRLFVGTPGRINDHLERGTVNFSQTSFLVLDETDRMLDMGFSIQIERIIKHLPKVRQTLLFSATLPKNIVKIADTYLNQPERVAMGSTTAPAQNLKQDIVHLSEDEKYPQLLTQLNQRSGSIIIFVKTKFGAEKMAKKLRAENHQTDAIHGDLRHSKRETVIRGFRNSKYRILVATDIAARGLDIPHIEHVINFDLPQCPEDYIHRIGRTARAGAEGEALCFVTPGDRMKWNAINRLLNPDAPPMKAAAKGGGGRKKDGEKRSYGFKKPFRSENNNAGAGAGRGNGGGYEKRKPSGPRPNNSGRTRAA